MGYPLDLFLDENIDEEFICAICHDVLQDVTMISSCEHIFCKGCIHVWKQTRATCPIDRRAMIKFQTPQRSFLNLLGRLRLRCPFTDLGCTRTITLGNAKEHEEKCEANPENQVIICPSGCGASFKKREGRSHVCPGNEAPAAAAIPGWVLPEGVPEAVQRATNIWSGILEWKERDATGSHDKEVQCSVMVPLTNPRIPITGENWPGRLTMRLLPKRFIFPAGRMDTHVFGPSDYIHFAFAESANLAALKSKLTTDFLGCVQLQNPHRMCILTFCRRAEVDYFVGIIPRQQQAFAAHLTSLIRVEQHVAMAGQRRPRTPTVVLRDINATGAAATIAAARQARDAYYTSAPMAMGNGSLRILIRRSDVPQAQPANANRPHITPMYIHPHTPVYSTPTLRRQNGPPVYASAPTPTPPVAHQHRNLPPFQLLDLLQPAAPPEPVPRTQLPPPTVEPLASARQATEPAPTNNSTPLRHHGRLQIHIRRSDVAVADAVAASQRREGGRRVHQSYEAERLKILERRIAYLERERNDLNRSVAAQRRQIINLTPPPPVDELLGQGADDQEPAARRPRGN